MTVHRRRAEAADDRAPRFPDPVARSSGAPAQDVEQARLVGHGVGVRADSIIGLQRVAGNHALTGLLREGTDGRGSRTAAIVQRDAARRSPVRTRSSSWPKIPRVADPSPPGSIAELRELLMVAANMLVDPQLLDAADRRKLYGNQKAFASWTADTAGCLRRLDDALDFVRPLVDAKNIASHGKDSTDATVLGLYHTTSWLQGAKAGFDRAQLERNAVTATSARSALIDAATRISSLLASQNSEKLKVLSDEGLSFELELGSNPKPAPEYRPEQRAQLPGGADLSKQEVRVLMWLRANKLAILDAEHDFGVDRLAIAAAIAWEAMNNIMAAGLRGVGPGKMHTYANKWAGVLPLSKGDAVPQQLEEEGYVPKPRDDEDRLSKLVSPGGAITYIAAAMKAAKYIAMKNGYDITHNIVALTSFYQGHDLSSWKRHMEEKAKRREKTWSAVDPMAVWASSHVTYLDSVLSSFGRPT